MIGLKMILVGTCGWSRIYEFLPPSKLSVGELRAYSEIFKVVEVDSSFYRFHKAETYRGWRRSVSEDFEFTLKCYRSITHEAMMRPTDEALRGMERMAEAARACGAQVLLLQTPVSLRACEESYESLNTFFERVVNVRVRLAWETRGSSWEAGEGLRMLQEILKRFNLIHVVDPLKMPPAWEADTLYFRLHGLPGYNLEYSYTNGNLETLLEKIKPLKERRVYIFFNNYAMYRDAYRFQKLLEDGKPPPSPFGPRSVFWALKPYEKWPASKTELIERCGRWRCWVAPDRRILLGEVLKHLEDRVYEGVEEVLAEAERVWRLTGFPSDVSI